MNIAIQQLSASCAQRASTQLDASGSEVAVVDQIACRAPLEVLGFRLGTH